MMMFLSTFLPTVLGLAVLVSGQLTCSDCETITRDVAVIGGGSSGTYTALRLRDRNYTVAVIEPQSHLGGHAETYTAPNNWTIDYGVIVFGNISAVTNYFARFNVPLVPLESGDSPTRFTDFSTGEAINYTPPSNEEVATGLANYAQQLAKYPALDSSFNLTYPVASDSDLLMPFGQFVKKYNMSGAMHTIFITNQGYAPLLDIPTIYMFKYLNRDQLNSFATAYLTTANHNIQSLYQKVAAYLGSSNVYLNSNVTAIDRHSSPARLIVSTPTGRKLIIARRVVIAAQPTLQNLRDIDLTPTETSLFSQFFANGYYTGILTNTSLPSNFSAQAIGRDASNYNIPTLPGIYSMSQNMGAPGHVQVYYGSPTVLPVSTVQDSILRSITALQKSLGVPQTTPSWAAFSAHTPFNLMVTPAAIQDRFYERTWALQGQNGTFWNGAAWVTQDSSVLWKWTDAVLMPKIVASLESGN